MVDEILDAPAPVQEPTSDVTPPPQRDPAQQVREAAEQAAATAPDEAAAAAAKAQAEAGAAAKAKAEAEAAAKAHGDAAAAAAKAQAEAEAAAKAHAEADAAKAQAEAEAAAQAQAQAEAEAPTAAKMATLQARAEQAEAELVQARAEAKAAAAAQAHAEQSAAAAHARADAEAAAAAQAREEAKAALAAKSLVQSQMLNATLAKEAAEARASAERPEAEQPVQAATPDKGVDSVKNLTMTTHGNPAKSASAYSASGDMKASVATHLQGAVEKAGSALGAVDKFFHGTVIPHGTFVVGTAVSAALGGAASTLTASRLVPGGVGLAAGLGALDALHYKEGNNQVAGFLREVGDYCYAHLAEIVLTGITLAPIAKGFYQASQDYGKHAVEQNANAIMRGWPLLASKLLAGAGTTMLDTAKGAAVGAGSALATLGGVALVSAAYAQWMGQEGSDIPPPSGAVHEKVAATLQEPVDLHAPVTLLGVMAEEYA